MTVAPFVMKAKAEFIAPIELVPGPETRTDDQMRVSIRVWNVGLNRVANHLSMDVWKLLQSMDAGGATLE